MVGDEGQFGGIQAIIDAIPYAVLLLDEVHRILGANRAVYHSLGKEVGEGVVGGFCPRVMHKMDVPCQNCFIDEVVKSGQFVVREIYDETNRRWISCGIFPTELRSPQGKLIYLHTLRDITERRKAQEERDRLKEEIMRTQRLDGIGRLAGGIAHDFNNLLTLILNYSTFVADALDEDDPIREDVERIRRAGKRAAALTRQLLAFSSKEGTDLRVIKLNELVSELQKLLQRTLTEDIDLITELEPGLWHVKADPSQMEQVLLNLALNARDAMPRGGRLIVQTRNLTIDEEQAKNRAQLPPGRYVQLRVIDTGSGMTTQVADRIFEPFFTTKAEGRGTGLGLSTVYGIVNQAGGKIDVDSELDRGTTFSVYLPATDEEFAAEIEEKPRADILGRGETILVVDDDEFVRSLVVRMLKNARYRVLEASNGTGALLAFQHSEGRVSLLVTDVVLEGMSGKELADLLGLLQPRTKILFISGYPDDKILQLGVRMREVAFLHKPFGERELLGKVREVLDNRQLAP
jgi:two-component system, cell cycle sensor histidine kinase and response regulator CckA